MKAVLGDDEPTDDIAILTLSIDRFAASCPATSRNGTLSAATRAPAA